jgi:hypothetical protein
VRNSQLQVQVTLRLKDSQSVTFGVEPRLGLMTRYLLLLNVTVSFSFCGAPLSDERTSLSFLHAADPSQRSLSRVRVPWNSRQNFTVSDLRLPFSSPPTIRRVTVEVFDPTSTRVPVAISCRELSSVNTFPLQRVHATVELLDAFSVRSVSYRRTVCGSVCASPIFDR